MFFARTHLDVHNIRTAVERAKRISDRLIGVGPLGVGLDGVLSFIPVVGLVYSSAAGALLVIDAVRVKASLGTVVNMAALLVANSMLDVIPIPMVSGVTNTLFTGHKWAADLMLKHMDETLYYAGSRRDAEADPAFHDAMARIRSGEETRRVVFLG